jgi:hypothetical protein
VQESGFADFAFGAPRNNRPASSAEIIESLKKLVEAVRAASASGSD